MLNSCQNVQERWGGVHQLIDRWLQERYDLVAAYVELQQALPKIDAEPLDRLCQVLVDYVSAWHFEVYGLLAEEAVSLDDRKALQLAEQIQPRLQALTEAALAFNDDCDHGECMEAEDFSCLLQQLGKQLHERFELEDCLIEVLHNAHQQKLAVVS